MDEINVQNKNLMIYTASGLRTDIETLFAKFDEQKSFDFKWFSKCFKDMKFGLIFRGRHNDNEMHEFIDESYLEVLDVLVNRDNSVSKRVCSLYLLYALYVKQPLDQSLKTRLDIKIRITLDQLVTIREFIDFCKQNSFFEVCYIWYKLVSVGIDFVYYRYSSLGPSNTRSANHFMFQNINSSTDKLITDLKKSVECHLKSIETNHEIYVDFKDKVFENNLDSKPNVISEELPKESISGITKLVSEFQLNKRHFTGRGRPSIWQPYVSNQVKPEVPEEDIKRKVGIKKKALKKKIKTESESIAQLLWSDDIIDSLKKVKARKAIKKQQIDDINSRQTKDQKKNTKLTTKKRTTASTKVPKTRPSKAKGY